MGKIRVKTFGNEEEEAKQKEEKDRKRAEKKARVQAVEVEPQTPTDDLASQGQALQTQAEQTKSEENKPQVKSKKSKFVKTKSRSAKYKIAILEVDKNKIYSLSEALELLKKVNLAKFDETVELHINTIEAGISGTVKLPHGTGKEIRVAIADDAIVAEVEKGKINFDILIAAPSMMPKLGKVARVLGPRGLMPNPKNGTISDNPEEAMKKFQGGQVGFKTESKIPVIHMSVGKMSFGDEKLSENIKTIITAVKKDRITSVTLKSTMSPGIKLNV